jgi:hypothetical protein
MPYKPSDELLTRLRFFSHKQDEWVRHAQRCPNGQIGRREHFLHQIHLGGDWNPKIILESGEGIYWTRCFWGVVESEAEFLTLLRQVGWDKEALMPPIEPLELVEHA